MLLVWKLLNTSSVRRASGSGVHDSPGGRPAHGPGRVGVSPPGAHSGAWAQEAGWVLAHGSLTCTGRREASGRAACTRCRLRELPALGR